MNKSICWWIRLTGSRLFGSGRIRILPDSDIFVSRSWKNTGYPAGSGSGSRSGAPLSDTSDLHSLTPWLPPLPRLSCSRVLITQTHSSMALWPATFISSSAHRILCLASFYLRKRPKSLITAKKSTEITEPKSQTPCDKITTQEATKITRRRRWDRTRHYWATLCATVACIHFQFHPRSANFDFEIAAVNAFRSTFPSVATYAMHAGSILVRNCGATYSV